MNSLRLMTYNVAGHIGRQHSFDAERIVRILGDTDADVVALQEVYEPTRGEGLISALQELGYRTIHFGPAVRHREGKYGNALLIRASADRIEECDLSVRDQEPRSAIRADFRHGEERIRVAATHFGLLPWEREKQIERLGAWLDELPDPVDRRFVLGDLNEWWPFSNRETLIRDCLGQGRRLRTFPARFPLLRLDRILVDRPTAKMEWRRVDHPEVAGASDHLPLLLEYGIDLSFEP